MKLLLIAAAIVAIGYWFLTNDWGADGFSATPAACIELAKERGLPHAIIEGMKRPHDELDALERTAIRSALSGIGADNACEGFLK